MSTGSSGADRNGPASDESYPEQRHAGKVGYGPNYSTKASFVDKIVGLTEELHGKVAHKPELVREGRDRYTGETKRRKALGLDDQNSPFSGGQDSSQASSPAPGTPQSDTSQTAKPPAHSMPGTASTTDPGSMAAKAHTSGSSGREEAATIAPQGSHSADEQAKGENVEHMKYVDEKTH